MNIKPMKKRGNSGRRDPKKDYYRLNRDDIEWIIMLTMLVWAGMMMGVLICADDNRARPEDLATQQIK